MIFDSRDEEGRIMIALCEERDRLRAENERLRAALEELSDGVCGARYGSGCDAACKGYAWRALQPVDPRTSEARK